MDHLPPHQPSRRNWLTTCLGIAAAGTPALTRSQQQALSLRPHPRLIARADDWRNLRERVAAQPDLALYHQALLQRARQTLAEPLLQPVKVGRRMLAVSRALLQRVLLWSYAFRTSDDPVFAQRALQEMLAAADFPDWNPSHFLDVGEATAGMALGFDALYDQLTDAQRQRIAEAIRDLGLRPGLDPSARHNFWHRAEHNWNQVCFGGLTLGALAVMDEPGCEADALALLRLARAGIAQGLKPYAPDGVYPEGPSYWAFGTSYQVLMIAALKSATGDSWALEQAPGFLPSAGACLQATGPSGRSYNFADGVETASFEPATFWFARELADPGLLLFERTRLTSATDRAAAVRRNRFAPLAALWWPQPATVAATSSNTSSNTSSDKAVPRLPLDWSGDGASPIAIFRNAWADPRSLYLASKGGSAAVNHGHMDAGSFVLERDGVRWVVDLGLQEYESLESKGVDLWSKRQDSQRWTVFRLNNRSHSTLTVDDRLHRVEGRAHRVRFRSEAGQRLVVWDLSAVFAGQARSVRRGLRVLPDGSVLLRDELLGLSPGVNVRWQLPTRAQVVLQGQRADLRQEGQSLGAQVLEPASATWAALSAEQPEPAYNAANPGVRLLVVDVPAPAQGSLTIVVRLGAQLDGRAEATSANGQALPSLLGLGLDDW